MFIEQIIEFELRGPGPRGRTCNRKLVIFMTKQRCPRKINLLLAAKNNAEGNVTCFPLPGPSQLQNLSKKWEL